MKSTKITPLLLIVALLIPFTSAYATIDHLTNQTSGTEVIGENITYAAANNSIRYNLILGTINPWLEEISFTLKNMTAVTNTSIYKGYNFSTNVTTYRGYWQETVATTNPERSNDGDWTTYSRSAGGTLHWYILNFSIEDTNLDYRSTHRFVKSGDSTSTLYCWNHQTQAWQLINNDAITGAIQTTAIPWQCSKSTQKTINLNFTLTITSGNNDFYDVNITGEKNGTISKFRIMNQSSELASFTTNTSSETVNITRAELTTIKNLLTYNGDTNFTLISDRAGTYEWSNFITRYSGFLNITFTNNTDMMVTMSNGSTIINGVTSYTKNLTDLKENEKITIEFTNKSHYSTDRGWYQIYEFYNDASTGISDIVLAPVIPNQMTEIYMVGEGGSQLSGYITVYKTEGGGIWKVVQRLETSGNPPKVMAYLLNDNSYMFKGEADNYEDGNTTRRVDQSSTIPQIKIDMSKTNPWNQWTATTNCAGYIYNSSTTCKLYISTDASETFLLYINQSNDTGVSTSYIESITTNDSSTYEKTINFSAAWPNYQLRIIKNGETTGRWMTVTYVPPKIYGGETYQGYIITKEGYNITTAHITVKEEYRNQYWKYFAVGMLFSFIIVAALIEHYKKGWGIPAGFLSVGLWGWIFPWAFIALIPIVLWIFWRYVYKKIAIDKA